MVQQAPIIETPLPPYFDRFIEERDRRLSAELGRLEILIQDNTRQIRDLRAEVDRRFTEAREERIAGFAKAKEELEALREEMNRRFAKAR